MPGGSGRGSRRRSTAGACASATSRGRHGRGSSARSAPVTSTTCEVGGTSSRSSSPIVATWSSTAESSRAIGSISSSASSRRARRATCRTSSRAITGGDSMAGRRRGPGRRLDRLGPRARLGPGGRVQRGRSSRIDCQAPTRIASAPDERQPGAGAQRGGVVGALEHASRPRRSRRARPSSTLHTAVDTGSAVLRSVSGADAPARAPRTAPRASAARPPARTCPTRRALPDGLSYQGTNSDDDHAARRRPSASSSPSAQPAQAHAPRLRRELVARATSRARAVAAW